VINRNGFDLGIVRGRNAKPPTSDCNDDARNRDDQDSSEPVRWLGGGGKGDLCDLFAGHYARMDRNREKNASVCMQTTPSSRSAKERAAEGSHSPPSRTRVPTFPQQRLRRRTNLPKLQNPPKSQGLTDSCAEPKFYVSWLVSLTLLTLLRRPDGLGSGLRGYRR
jgi:hypothetical protein